MSEFLDSLSAFTAGVDWATLFFGAVIGSAVAYPLARRQAGQQALLDVWEAIDAAETGFHPPGDEWSHGWHEWCAGLEGAWKQMERTGQLAKLLPRIRYREIRRELISLANARPTGEQGAILHGIRDPNDPRAHHRHVVAAALPDEDTMRRIYSGRELVRRALRPI